MDPFLAVWYVVVEGPVENYQLVHVLQLHLFSQLLEVLGWVVDVEEEILNTLHELHFLELPLSLFDELGYDDA